MEQFVALLVIHAALCGAQETMTNWLVPGGIKSAAALSALLPILDNVTLVRAQRLLAA